MTNEDGIFIGAEAPHSFLQGGAFFFCIYSRYRVLTLVLYDLQDAAKCNGSDDVECIRSNDENPVHVYYRNNRSEVSTQ
jgi:hypothetical protein